MLITLLMCFFFFCHFHLLFQLIYLLIHLEQIPVLMQDSLCSDDGLPLWKRDFVWKERTHAEECDSVLRVNVGELEETEVFVLMRPPFASPASIPPFQCPRWKNDCLLFFPQLLLLLLSRFSRVRLCATPETAAHQSPPSLGFSRQEHWSGLLFRKWFKCRFKHFSLINCGRVCFFFGGGRQFPTNSFGYYHH